MMLGAVAMLVLLVFGAVVLVAAVAAVALSAAGRSPVLVSAEVAAARRHAVTTAALAGILSFGAPLALVLVFAAVVMLGLADLPFVVPAMSLACAPLVGALAGILVLLFGELTWPRPSGTSRTVLLRDRSMRNLLDGGWVRGAAVAVGVTVVGLLAGGLIGADGGQSVEHGDQTVSRSAGPFPGWGYTVPQLLVLAACVAAALFTLRAVAARSAVVTADAATDDLLRAASVARVSRLLCGGALVTLGADLFIGGAAAARVFDDGWHGVALGAMAAGPVVVLLGLVTLLLPVPRLADLAVPVLPPAPPVRA